LAIIHEDPEVTNRSRPVVVMMFLTLSSLLIVNALEVLKEDRLSITEFKSGIQDSKIHCLVECNN